MIKKIFKSTFFRFVLVGITNGVVGYGTTFVFLNFLRFSYFFSTVIGYVFGFINSFILNKIFTYKNDEKILKTIWKFLIIFILSYAASYYSGLLCAYLIFDKFHLFIVEKIIRDNVAVICGMFFYTTVNYFGNKLFTFKKREGKE
jgi:putative flippase GtrA